MSNIALRRNGKYRARYRDAAGKEHARHFDRKRDAQKWLDTVNAAVQTGSYVDPSRSKVTVGTLADQWFAGKVNLKPSTRALYQSILDTHVRPRWAAVPLTRVQHGDVQAWVAKLHARGLSGGHVRKIAGALSGILELAVKDRRLPSNPAAGVNLPRVFEEERRYLSAAQVFELADAAQALPAGRPRRATDAAFHQYRLVILVLAYCGLRWSELAALRVKRVDLLKRRLVVAEAVVEVDGSRLEWGTPKSHEARSVPIPSFLAGELAAHLAGKAPDDLVFTSPGGDVLRNRNARRAWFNRSADAIGVPGLTPHELRHTAASLAVSSGANVKAVQRILGHASAALTLDRYADLFEDDLDGVGDRLDAVAQRAMAEAADRLRTDGRVVQLSQIAGTAAAQ